MGSTQHKYAFHCCCSLLCTGCSCCSLSLSPLISMGHMVMEASSKVLADSSKELEASNKELAASSKDLVVFNNQLNSMPLDFHVRSFAAIGSVVNINAVRPSRTPSRESSSPPIIEVQIKVFSFLKQTVI